MAAHVDCRSPNLLPDEGPDIIISGLAPNSVLQFELALRDDESMRWAARAAYQADAGGLIATRTTPPLGAAAADPTRLFWALAPETKDITSYLGATKGRSGRPYFVRPRTIVCDVRVTQSDAAPINVSIARDLAGYGTAIEDIHDGLVHGRLYMPAGAPRGGVVVVPGSSGGVDMTLAPALAARGYCVLAPALFAWPGRPDFHERVSLETIAQAVALVCRRAGHSDATLIGSSRGAEAVILTALHAPNAINGVIALAPGNVVTPGWTPAAGDTVPPWTFKGGDIPFFVDGFADLQAGGEDSFNTEAGAMAKGFTRFYRNVFANPAARAHAELAVERLHCPLLLIAGDADGLWDASFATTALQARAGAKAQSITLQGGGHVIAPAATPTQLSTMVFHAMERRYYQIGGSPKANADANVRAWAAILDFLTRCCGDE